MPTDVTLHTALILVADGFLFGLGFHVAALLLSAVVARMKRQP